MKYISTTLLVALASLSFQQSALALMQLRAPIRTWAGSGLCLCPYDQVVTSGISLMFPDEVYTCGEASAYVRTGGREPACYVEDMSLYGHQEAMLIEQECMMLSSRYCYVDFLNRF